MILAHEEWIRYHYNPYHLFQYMYHDIVESALGAYSHGAVKIFFQCGYLNTTCYLSLNLTNFMQQQQMVALSTPTTSVMNAVSKNDVIIVSPKVPTTILVEPADGADTSIYNLKYADLVNLTAFPSDSFATIITNANERRRLSNAYLLQQLIINYTNSYNVACHQTLNFYNSVPLLSPLFLTPFVIHDVATSSPTYSPSFFNASQIRQPSGSPTISPQAFFPSDDDDLLTPMNITLQLHSLMPSSSPVTQPSRSPASFHGFFGLSLNNFPLTVVIIVPSMSFLLLLCCICMICRCCRQNNSNKIAVDNANLSTIYSREDALNFTHFQPDNQQNDRSSEEDEESRQENANNQAVTLEDLGFVKV